MGAFTLRRTLRHNRLQELPRRALVVLQLKMNVEERFTAPSEMTAVSVVPL